jgi:hypothetical protein
MSEEVSLEGMSPEAISGLALLAKGLSNNPETRNEFLKLTKKANPSMSIPEVDIPLSMDGLLAAERTEREKLEKELLKDRVERDVEKRRNNLKVLKGLSDADIAEVEKLMVDKNIASHETAADFYNMQKKSATPTPGFAGFGSQQVPKPETKDFGGNIANWARNEAAKTIHDIRSGAIKI